MSAQLRRLWALMLACLALATATPANASVEGQVGGYRLKLTTEPRVVPVGPATLRVEVRDGSGALKSGLGVRVIARMPGMPMGEREQPMAPANGEPGIYLGRVAFPMAGQYEIALTIGGSQGVLSVSTGQDTGATGTGSGRGFGPLLWLAGLVLVAVWAYVALRRKPGAPSRGTVVSVVFLLALAVGAFLIVRVLRRPGSMTPLEAQGMQMNTPPPQGTVAVTLAKASSGPLSETVRYSGQAVGFVEQDLNPRVSGVIVWMPFYVGDRVKRGQVLARLDTSQLDPQLAERAAMTSMAAEGVGVAATEFGVALQEISQARAEAAAKQGAIEEAEAMLSAARQDREAMAAEALAVQGEVTNAEAEVEAARQNATFRADELARMRQLLAQKAVTASELQQAQSEAADAQSKLRQAQSAVRQAQSRVAAAQANVRKAGSMITAAQKKLSQARADLQAAEAAVRTKLSAAEAAKRRIGREQAGVAQARAGYQSAAAQRGYAALKAEIDGVVSARLISPGTLVNPGQTVLRVSQLRPIRLQANVAEADLARIKVGASASIEIAGRTGGPIQARVSSVSPALDPRSRTGVVEVLWPNADGEVLPGQLVTMTLEVGDRNEVLSIPSGAVREPTGDGRAMVWAAQPAGEEGLYTVRRASIRVGASSADRTAILEGLEEGQMVVLAGGGSLSEGAMVTSAAGVATEAARPVVLVTPNGYEPSTLRLPRDATSVVFIRKTDQTCGTEIVFPQLGIRKPLPLGQPVEVRLPTSRPAELRFTCGMNMLQGMLK